MLVDEANYDLQSSSESQHDLNRSFSRNPYLNTLHMSSTDFCIICKLFVMLSLFVLILLLISKNVFRDRFWFGIIDW